MLQHSNFSATPLLHITLIFAVSFFFFLSSSFLDFPLFHCRKIYIFLNLVWVLDSHSAPTPSPFFNHLLSLHLLCPILLHIKRKPKKVLQIPSSLPLSLFICPFFVLEIYRAGDAIALFLCLGALRFSIAPFLVIQILSFLYIEFGI